MHSKYGRHHMYQYFHGPKRPCGGEAKLMKLCLYTVLIQYYLCTKEQLLTDTTTYLNFQSFNSSLITFAHAAVSPVKNKSHGFKSVLTILNCVYDFLLHRNSRYYNQIDQSSPTIKISSIVELLYACEKCIKHLANYLLVFLVYVYIS